MLYLQTKQSKVRPTASDIKSNPFHVCFCKVLTTTLAMLLFASGAWALKTDTDSQIGTSETPKNLVVTGKLGVGTSSPNKNLDVDGDVKISGQVEARKFIGEVEGTWNTNGSNILYTNGNVGIGTSYPARTLEVNGTVKASQFEGDGSGLTNINSWQTVPEGINYPGGKRVGINRTQPLETLDIYGNMRLGETQLGGFREGTINRVLKVEDNRKVSIGPNNSNSSEALSVDGDASISGNLQVNGTGRFNELYVGDKLVNPDHQHGGLFFSDLRLKENVKPIKNVLPKLQQVDGVYFDWKQPKHDSQKGRQIGVIAQAVQAQFPELVTEGGDGYKSVAYGQLSAVLIEAIKELKRDNDLLAARIKALEEK